MLTQVIHQTRVLSLTHLLFCLSFKHHRHMHGFTTSRVKTPTAGLTVPAISMVLPERSLLLSFSKITYFCLLNLSPTNSKSEIKFQDSGDDTINQNPQSLGNGVIFVSAEARDA